MDRTDTVSSLPEQKVSRPSGSQSKLSPIFLWVFLAAALFRLVTAVTEKKDVGGAGLIRWMAPEAAASAARNSGKPILYDFTADWCPPCHILDREGWADPKVAALVNGSYLPVRVVDRTREEGKNPPGMDELQQRYRVSAFPTLVVAAPDGREIAISAGYAGKQRLVTFLEGSRGK